MINFAHYKFATQRIMSLFASIGLCTTMLVAGCGGGTNPVISPTPGPSTEPGRGGALSDTCNQKGTYIDQPGWASSCGVPVQPKRKWTVLLYMNGANDLEEYGTLNINQMEKYGSDKNVTFVAQFKRIHSTEWWDDTGDGDWSGARRFVVRQDNNSSVGSPIVSSRADIDMGNPQTLKEFIAWGVQTFPAEHYAIVLWNHGAGWRSKSTTGTRTRGFSYDDEKNTHIDTI